jgi:hypothetical protein
MDGMIGINDSQTRIARVAETTWGVTPTSPAFENMRSTRDTLQANKRTVTSEERRPDRNVSDVIQVARSASGNIPTEFAYGAYDDEFESALFGTWSSGDVLKNGTTYHALTYEKTFAKPGGSSIFHRFAGCIVDTMALSVTAEQLIGLEFGVMGKGVTQGITALSGATYAAANTNPVLSAAADFASLSIVGLSSTPAIQSLTLNTSNGLRQRMAIGDLNSKGIGTGRFTATGTINAYFEDEELYALFLSHGEIELGFTLGTESGSTYDVLLPRLKLTEGTVQSGGNDSDVMANLNFQALYDTDIAATMQITRGA